MAIAQGSCPSCGAPIVFGLGSSLARICESCRATVLRTDRGLQDCGRVAALAETPSPISVGDQGTLAGRPIFILGRVQFDYGLGPWDEYYVAFDQGSEWGWLAYAQGRWYVTQLVPNQSAPPREQIEIDGDQTLPIGTFCVTEFRTAKVVSAEGELPSPVRAGTPMLYADAYGPDGAFATFDYGDGSEPSCVYAGHIFSDAELSVTASGPRAVAKVKTTQLQCPNCGGEVPKLHADRSERLGCPYCGALSDIPSRTVLAQQERLLQSPDIPIGTSGTFEGATYTCLAYLQRSVDDAGDRYRWEEYLLFCAEVGYRWLVKDPETGWSWVAFVNPADIDRRERSQRLRYSNQVFRLKSSGQARVDYVLGEIYWKCSLGEVVSVADYSSGNQVLSREADSEEVNYSHSRATPWPKIAAAFGLPVKGTGANGIPSGGSGGSTAAGCITVAIIVIFVIVLIIVLSSAFSSTGGSSGGGVFIGGGNSYRGSGSYSGGK